MFLIFYLLIPFSYLEVLGIRLVVLQAILGGGVIFGLIKNSDVEIPLSFLFLFLLLSLSALYGLMAGNYSDFFSTFVFYLLFISSFYSARQGYLSLEGIKGIYVFCCFFISIGLIFQFSAHKLFNVELFRYMRFGDSRNAYSFIWSDFSFASLFVISCFPILFRHKRKVLATLIFLFLFFASIITSARTGLTAFFLFVLVVLFWRFLTALVSGRLLIRYLMLFFFTLALPFSVLYFLPLITGRELTFSSSGRLGGFYAGFEYLSTHPFLGALLDKSFYVSAVATVPHNLFLYALFMGGVTYFFFFVGFILSLFWDVRHADSDFLATLLICFFGFQFIPSFFSAYFIAILLGVSVASSVINRQTYQKNNYECI